MTSTITGILVMRSQQKADEAPENMKISLTYLYLDFRFSLSVIEIAL